MLGAVVLSTSSITVRSSPRRPVVRVLDARCAAQHAGIAHSPPRDRQARLPPPRARPLANGPTSQGTSGADGGELSSSLAPAAPRGVTMVRHRSGIPERSSRIHHGSPAAPSSRDAAACETTLDPWGYVVPGRSTAPGTEVAKRYSRTRPRAVARKEEAVKKQAPKSGDLEREASSWNCIDLALVAVRFAEEANVVAAHRPPSGLLHTTWDPAAPIGALRPWCYRTPTGYAAWFTSAAMVTARLRAMDLETAADLVERKIAETLTYHVCPRPRSRQIRFAPTIFSSGSSTTSAGACAWLVHPRTATWQ